MVEVIAPHQNPHKVKLWTNDFNYFSYSMNKTNRETATILVKNSHKTVFSICDELKAGMVLLSILNMSLPLWQTYV
jgi:hypothetical protein